MLKSPLAIKREITCLPSGRKNLLRVPPLAEWKKLDTKHLFCCGLRPPNRRLLDRKLIFDFQKPFDFLPKYTEKCESRRCGINSAPPQAGRASQQTARKIRNV